jgi:O-methyltransferase involved in polyketide biosynthesis
VISPFAYSTAPPREVTGDGPFSIMFFDAQADHPDWQYTGEHYRKWENAKAACAAQNARVLAVINTRRQDDWHRQRNWYLDELMLYRAGRREVEPVNPGPPPEPITELPEDYYCERYAVTAMEFEDD